MQSADFSLPPNKRFCRQYQNDHPTHPLAPSAAQAADPGRDLLALGITLPPEKGHLIQGEATAHLAAFARAVRDAGQPDAWLATPDEAAFKGGMLLLREGLLPHKDGTGPEACDLVQKLVLHDTAGVLDETGLQARFKALHEAGVALEPALYTAIEAARADNFLPLISAGADPFTNVKGDNALHAHARLCKDLPVESCLAAFHALVDARVPLTANEAGRTPLRLLQELAPSRLDALIDSAVSEPGRLRSRYMLSVAHACGCGVEKNDRKAFKWLVDVAEAGHAHAQFMLGVMIEQRRGTRANPAAATEWFAKAAAQGVGWVAGRLGRISARGGDAPLQEHPGLPANQRGPADDRPLPEGLNQSELKNYRDLETLFAQVDDDEIRFKSRQPNFRREQFHLGMRKLASHTGGTEALASAVDWFERSAKPLTLHGRTFNGYAPAQFYLGVMHFEGLGVDKNEAQAAGWFQQAADQGDASAQLNLGWMYAYGRGVRQDDFEALKWLGKAQAQGLERAGSVLDQHVQALRERLRDEGMSRPHEALVIRLMREVARLQNSRS